MDQVRGEIIPTLTQKAQRAQLETKVKALEARLAAGETLAAIASELGKTPNVADAVVRTAGNQDGRILEQVFKMPRPAGAPVRKAIRLGDDEQALVELTAVVDGDPKAAEQAARDAARSQLVGQWTEAETGAYVKALRKHAEIKIAEDRL